jgi:hypothetical protein
MMMRCAIAFMFIGTSSLADTIQCKMNDGSELSYSYDADDIATVLDPEVPEHLKGIPVRYGPKTFAAYPFERLGYRGFLAQGTDDELDLFAMKNDGQGAFTDAGAGTRVYGECEATE